MKKSIRTIIIGAGHIAGLNEMDPFRKKPCTHVGMYKSNSNFDLVAIVDIDPAKAKDFAVKFRLKKYFTDISTALDDVQPDLVSVAVPYQFHHDVVIAVATNPNRSKIIFCEKPIADTIEKAEAMIATCKSNGVRFLVNNRRLMSIYQECKKIISERFHNEVITINGWCSSGLHAIGIHMIDLLRFLCGEIAWVQSVPETEYVESLPYSTNFEPEDQRVRSLIGYENGIVGGFFNTALTAYTYFEIEIHCKEGKIRVSDNGNLLQIWNAAPPSESTLSYRLSEPLTKEIKDYSLFANISKALAVINEIGDNHPLSGREALESYRVLEAMVRSSKTRQRVTLVDKYENGKQKG